MNRFHAIGISERLTIMHAELTHAKARALTDTEVATLETAMAGVESAIDALDSFI